MDIRCFLSPCRQRPHDSSEDIESHSKRPRIQEPVAIAHTPRTANLDIAACIGQRLSDEEKFQFLRNSFKPDSSYKFPFTKFGKRQRCFQFSWLAKYPGLVYSPSTDGAFCLYCCLFPGGGNRKGQLVTEPFQNWKKAIERYDEHFHKKRHYSTQSSSSSHKKPGTGFELHMVSFTRGVNFTNCMENKQVPVPHLIDAALEERKQKNMRILETIVDTVLFCGRQNIALRGHRDDSSHSLDPSFNTGNFKALLQYRVNGGDRELGYHLENASKNATYISKSTQNEIIKIIGETILQGIVSDCVSNGGYYSLSADEVRDVGNDEQLAVTIRFVDQASDIREAFLTFVNVSEGTTGENLSRELLDLIDRVGLDPKKMRSQCYDGAGNMTGKIKGVGARIQREYPKALPFWCTAHQLNRCIVQACIIPAIRNMMSTADQVVRFFEFSPKKQNSLEKAIDNLIPDNNKRKLKELCRTRWVERHDAFEIFINFLPPIIDTLETYAKLPNTRTPGAADASSLLNSICTFDFLVCLTVVHKCLGFMRGLSKSLQERRLDVVKALKNVSLVKSSIQECRDSIDDSHGDWYREAVTLAEEFDIPITKPRTCRRQTQRNNIPADTPEDYYKKSISIPMLDHLLEEMKTRFSDLHQRAALGLMLVPTELETSIDVDELKTFFRDDMPSPSSFDAELTQWTSYWKHQARNQLRL